MVTLNKKVLYGTEGEKEARAAQFERETETRRKISQSRIAGAGRELLKFLTRKAGQAKGTAVRAGRYATAPKAQRVYGRTARMIYPVIPRQAAYVAVPNQRTSGKGRGRPKRAYASKYAAYGGVFGYRKYIRAQRAAQKYQTILRQQQMVRQQYQQMKRGRLPPQMIQQIQVSPQELSQEISQVPQQIPSQAIRRPVGRITPSYGGKPYPAVDMSQLQGTRDSEYYEAKDMFTGRTLLKKRPQAEAWIRPKY